MLFWPCELQEAHFVLQAITKGTIRHNRLYLSTNAPRFALFHIPNASFGGQLTQTTSPQLTFGTKMDKVIDKVMDKVSKTVYSIRVAAN